MKFFFRSFIIILFFFITSINDLHARNIKLNIKKLSFYALDQNGNLIPETKENIKKKNFFKKGNKYYSISKQLDLDKSALVIIDPWETSANNFLSEKHKEIYLTKILPLINISVEKKLNIFIFTNKFENKGYNEKIYRELQVYVNKRKIIKKTHQNVTDIDFAKILKKKKIENLIYLGFSSNMCIINRRVGILGMTFRNFKTYFIPEASMALERENWEQKTVHKYTTDLISRNSNGLIDLSEFKNRLQALN